MSVSEYHLRIKLSDRRALQRFTKAPRDQLLLLVGEESRSIAHRVLRDAVNYQMSLMGSGRFDRFKSQEDADFLNAFCLDSLFTDLFSEAQEMAPQCSDSDIGFQNRLRGALFEGIAYAFFSSSETDSRIPLMGESAFRLSRAVNTRNRIDNFGLGQIGIAGVYVPDGYMVDAAGTEPYITGVLECKLSTARQEKVTEQKSRADYEFKKLGPMVTSDPHFIVVLPNFSFSVSPVDGTEIIHLPIQQAIFENQFFNFVYYQHRVGSGKTLAEMRQERVPLTLSVENK